MADQIRSIVERTGASGRFQRRRVEAIVARQLGGDQRPRP